MKVGTVVIVDTVGFHLSWFSDSLLVNYDQNVTTTLVQSSVMFVGLSSRYENEMRHLYIDY